MVRATPPRSLFEYISCICQIVGKMDWTECISFLVRIRELKLMELLPRASAWMARSCVGAWGRECWGRGCVGCRV
jgi:hypothetical protein